MSYLDQANLTQDQIFSERLGAALSKEAKPKDDNLARMILSNPRQGVQAFMPYIASEPGFDTAYAAGGQAAIEDPMILSAIQANWNAVLDNYFPPISQPVP